MGHTDQVSDEKPTLLITGASGFLGDALCRLATDRWSVFGVFRRNGINIPGVVPVQADLTDDAALAALVSDLLPRAVIHTAADSQVMSCEFDPEPSRAINCRVPARLAKRCADAGIDFLFTSTDLVFDGLDAPYDEQAGIHPICEYARQKAVAEEAVLRHHARALVCRLPLMFGLAPNAHRHFTVQMLTAIAAGRPLDLFVDEFRTPVDTISAAKGILTVMGKVSGVLHLGGRSRVSRYDLGLVMAEKMEKEPTMLKPIAIGSRALAVPRSPDCALVSAAAYGLGYDPLPLEDAMAEVVRRFLGER